MSKDTKGYYSVIYQDEDYKNNKQCQTWLFNGYFHRLTGSAVVYYYKCGSIKIKDYYINGKYIYIKNTKDFKKYVKMLAFI